MDFPLPELGEGVYEAETVRWLVKPGDTVKPGQNLLEVLTDKATMEVPAPFAGTIETLNLGEGEKVKIGDVILNYRPAGQAADAPKEPKKETKKTAPLLDDPDMAVASQPPPSDGPARGVNGPPARTTIGATASNVKAAPSVRLMARKLGIDLSRVQGSGPQGRVLIDDLSQFVQSTGQTDGKRQKPPAPKEDHGRPGTRVKLAGIRRRIAEHMVHAKQVIPHYSYVDECDVTDLVKLRDMLKEAYAAKGARLTYLAFMVKAVVGALKEVPIVNSSLDDKAGEIVFHDQYHIGVAVAIPGGLVVPVVHNADKLTLLDIAKRIEQLSSDARAGKSKLEDLRGGTFTITSIGNIGGLFASPIISHPQVGILGLGKIVKRPIYDEQGQIKPADMLYLSFAFDHRVLDGAVGCVFGNAIIRRLRNPGELLVD